jgi:SAM-dependent methyltransferase
MARQLNSGGRPYRLLYSATIGCSSILLFSVQPMMAKALLPRFGGSAGVWVTCMLFFQVMLLAGYFYSWAITTGLGRGAQSGVHAALLIFSLTSLSLRPHTEWAQGATAHPALSILAVLAISVGLPYFLLSSTSPLLQSWFATSTEAAFPYRLFALSNAASLLALLAYPVIIEPLMTQSAQLRGWSAGYALLVALACATAIAQGRRTGPGQAARTGASAPRPVLWIALAACASTLWMAVANHLSREVAPVPFLWVLPLSIYLLSFILCFEGEGWYRPALFRWLLPAAWVAAAFRIAGRGPSGLPWEIAIFAVSLFVWCMFCHGEIARTKPGAGRMTYFYLMIALGGAIGGLFVGVAAPNLLSTYLELPIGITVSALLALRLIYGMTSPWRLARLGAVALAAFAIATRFQAGFGDVVHLRNFYGALQVTDAGTGETAIRALYNGRTLHGVEFLAKDRSRLPTAYYGPESGAGRVLLAGESGARRVGIVGLGTGTLAAYGRRGDVFRFYEINPAVIDVASKYFHFLDASEARTDIVEGDGRLALERESGARFDILVLDAFADDSIPVHLLTKEAFVTYFRLLRQDGVLAIHLTNRYLELAPVVEAAADDLGKRVVNVHSVADPGQQVIEADWALVSGSADAVKEFGNLQTKPVKTRLWTDDYSNLFQVLK